VKPQLLIIDDDEEIRTQMKWALSADYEVSVAADRSTGLQIFGDQRPAVVLLDLGLPPNPNAPEEGLAALSEMLSIDKTTKVLVVSGQGERENALQAIEKGAYDFLCKPVQLGELQVILRRALYVADLERDLREMRSRLKEDTFEGMLGGSKVMQSVFESIRKVATTDAPVLILGESGTGKEMAAQAIHRRSTRKEGPFIAINCGAIPETLLESELFGHEKGAFTGAHTQRPGRIETAAGGTLFLDEIGELPPPLQVKLLRFLQEQRIERVGGRKGIDVDVRVICATNADLKTAISEGRFREDLYYRVAVVILKLPALRERPDDVALLAHAFLQRCAVQHDKESLRFNRQSLAAIQLHDWPGNVRELENRVRRAVIMADGPQVAPADLELSESSATVPRLTLKQARDAVERELIEQALRRHSGNITAAATDLAVSRPTLYELMERHGIKKQ
jgi:two-component system NtrC family response regulator